jgi:hypothetical protein
MLYQFHWQYRGDRPTRFVRQFELLDTMSDSEKHSKISKIMVEINKDHPLPKDAQWMLCNEKSRHFE